MSDPTTYTNFIAVFNVRAFGAKGDGVTDDANAFDAAIAAMGPAPQAGPNYNGAAWYGQRLYIPPAEPDPIVGFKSYFLSRTLRIQRQMIIEGATGSGWFGSSILQFGRGVTGVLAEAPASSPTGGYGAWTIIRDLVLKGHYVGYNVPSLAGGNYYRPWLPNYGFNVGDVITPTTRYLNLAGRSFQAESVEGLTSGSEPDFDDVGKIVFVDGGVTWNAVDVHGIQLLSRANIENVYIDGFAGNGIHILAGTPLSNANSWRIGGICHIQNCGGNGVYAHGNDSNQGKCEGGRERLAMQRLGLSRHESSRKCLDGYPRRRESTRWILC